MNWNKSIIFKITIIYILIDVINKWKTREIFLYDFIEIKNEHTYKYYNNIVITQVLIRTINISTRKIKQLGFSGIIIL